MRGRRADARLPRVIAALRWAVDAAIDSGAPTVAFSALTLARELLPAAGLALDDLQEQASGYWGEIATPLRVPETNTLFWPLDVDLMRTPEPRASQLVSVTIVKPLYFNTELNLHAPRKVPSGTVTSSNPLKPCVEET